MTAALNHSPSYPAGIAAERLSDADFARMAAIVIEHTGIKLPPGKKLMVEGRLRKRLRELRLNSLSDYCRHLFEGDGLKDELPHLTDAVTTNKTDFFRELEHFHLLRGRLVPSLLADRRGSARPRLKVWSAASSTGAEAYTIAMVLHDMAGSPQRFQFSILGTDISNAVLRAAERAVYSREMIEPVPAEMQRRYVLHGRTPAAAREVRIAPELRSRVRFAHLNLMEPTYPIDRDVDVIFLRNVLIYFERDTQEQVVTRLASHLRPGGFLVLGHSESMIGSSLGFAQWAPGVFHKAR